MSNAAVEEAGPVVEKFASSSGRILGYVAGCLLVVFAVGAAVSDFSANRPVILSCLAAALLAYIALIRPGATAHANGLLLHNILRDTYIPWSKIERCAVFQTLQVVTPEGTFHGLGLSRSTRSMIKGEKVTSGTGDAFLGFGRGIGSAANPSRRANEEAVGGKYTDYVPSRILSLAQRGKGDDARPVVAFDPLAVATLVVALICIALAFV